MKKTVATLLVAGILSGSAIAATPTTAKTLPTVPYVVDGYTPDTRTAEAKESYANRVVKSDVEGNNHSVFGQDNTVDAIHGSSSVYGNQNVVGADAKDGNIFGDGSSITGYQSQAVGDNNHLKGEQNTGIGMNNVVNGDHTHAIGGGNNITGSRATAVGHYNLITSDEATTVGYDNKAHVRGVAIGFTNNATNHGVAIGVETKAIGESSTAIGVHANSTGLSTIAIGSNSVANNKASTAIGQGATATASYGVALGKAAQANHGSAVALGTAAVTESAVAVNEATVGKITYGGFAGTDATAVVSVGAKGDHTRQIINVGAGEISATSTDAINGSQLYATNDVINNVAGSVTTVLGGNAQVDNKGNITMTDVGGTGESTVHNAIKSHTDKIDANAKNVAANSKAIIENTKYIQAVEQKLPEVQSGENTVVTSTTDANGKVTYTVSSKDFQPAIDKVEAKADANTNYIKAVEQKLPEVQAGDNTTVDVTVDANGKAVYTVSSKDFQPAIDANTAKIAENTKAIETNAEGVKANTAKIQEVEKEAKRHTVVKAGQNVQVTKEFGENGEAVYTVGVETNHLATKAELGTVKVGVMGNYARIENNRKAIEANSKAIRKLDRDVRKNRKRADAGIASVAAMANIPQVYLPGKSGVGVGVGHKHGQSALAIGYSRTSDNAHHIIKLSAGVDSQKDVTVGAGYMYQW
jgi:autotransporter adhesin